MQSNRSKHELKRKSLKGGAIAVSAQLLAIVIQIISIAVLSRLLSPEDFGIIAMTTAVTAFVGLFRDMGLSTASIQKGLLSAEQINMLFWLNVIAGLVLMLLVMAISPAIAWFYKLPELQEISMLLSTIFLISSVGAQHGALMKRELRFGPKAIADVTGALMGLLVAVLMAKNGWRYWAIAWGTVGAALVTTTLYFFASSFRPGLPRRAEGMRQILGFGADVTFFEFINYFHRNFDNILIGRFWGAIELGFYSRAYQMMMLPITSLRTPINSVAFPVLSKLQNDPEEFRRYYCQISSVLAFLSMPLMAFLVVNGKTVVTIALGERWEAVTPIFVLLGITGFIQPVASLRGMVLLSLGKSKRYLGWGIINATVVCLAFLLGIGWGSVGVASAYAAANYLILYPSLKFLFRDTPVKPIDFLNSIFVPLYSSISAACAVLLAAEFYEPSGEAAKFFLAAGIFIACFSSAVFATSAGRSQVRSYFRLLQSFRN